MREKCKMAKLKNGELSSSYMQDHYYLKHIF